MAHVQLLQLCELVPLERSPSSELLLELRNLTEFLLHFQERLDRVGLVLRVVMIAAGDYLLAGWADRAGIDIIGIGDSIGMTLYGHETTIPMTVDAMIEPS